MNEAVLIEIEQLRAEVERLKIEVKATGDALEGSCELSEWKSGEIERLQAQAAAMREALEALWLG